MVSETLAGALLHYSIMTQPMTFTFNYALGQFLHISYCVTVKDTGGLVILPNVAVILALPSSSQVAKPLRSIVTENVLLLVQIT